MRGLKFLAMILAIIGGYLALSSAPASAAPDPGPGYPGTDDRATTATTQRESSPAVLDSSWELVQVATGALGGLGIAVVGYAGFEVTRRRTHHGHAVG